MKRQFKFTIAFFTLLFMLGFVNQAMAFNRGIYLTQETAQNKTKMANFIAQAKKYDIDTFVVDVNVPSKGYAASIANILQNGIHYVARIVIFPHGGSHAQVTNQAIWEKRLKLAKYAVGLGASAIQLDYIRYRSENPASPAKAQRVATVVKYFKNQLASSHAKLQMDIFGIAADRPAHTIGHDVSVLAPFVNAFCPMVYPSHYEPFRAHAVRPYETVFNSVTALKKQLAGHPDVSVYAYLELFNYRFPLSASEKMKYIIAEMKAAHDSGANGWYVWSATNYYGPLWRVLANKNAPEKQ